MISHIHIVLLTIRIIFVVPRNRSSGQILLHIWIVSGICIIYDDGSPVRVVFHWHYIHKNYRWEASSEDSRRGTRTFIFSPCNIIRKEDHLWWEREQLTYGEIMVLSVFRVEHAIVVVEFYAIVFPLCKYISTPKSDRKSHWLWTISNHPTKIALILNSDNQKLWRKIEGYPKATQKYLIPDRLHWVPSSLVAQYLKVVPTTSQLQESTSSATVWDPTHGNSL